MCVCLYLVTVSLDAGSVLNYRSMAPIPINAAIVTYRKLSDTTTILHRELSVHVTNGVINQSYLSGANTGQR